MTTRRRLPAAVRIAPGTLERLIVALGADTSAANALRRELSLTVFDAGGVATRAETTRLRKRLIRAVLRDIVDHRSGPYAEAKKRVWRAVDAELFRSSP